MLRRPLRCCSPSARRVLVGLRRRRPPHLAADCGSRSCTGRLPHKGNSSARSWLSVLVGAPLVLTPLYSTQNYYPAAISPVVAMVVGLGVAWAWANRRRPPRSLRDGSRGGAVGRDASAHAATIGRRATSRVVDRDGSLAAAAFVRERTAPDDWVVISGRGWDPTILYYANRRGYMLDDRREADIDDLDLLRADPSDTRSSSAARTRATCTEMSP